MKNKILPITVMLALLTSLFIVMLSSFVNPDEKSMARVNFVQGFYVFTDSNPVSDFETVGTEIISMGAGSTNYEKVRDVLLKRARKDYPSADGLIISFPGTATVVKFK